MQSRRPWRIRLTCNSYTSAGSVSAHERREPPRRKPSAGSTQAATTPGRRGCRPAVPGGRRRRAARRPPSCGRRRAAARGTRSPLRAARSASGSRSRPPRSAAIAPSIAWMRRDLTSRCLPGRIASSTSSTGASATLFQSGELGLPGPVEPRPQSRIGHVPVAVVGVLREHRQHELVERSVVRLVARMPVESPQPVADRADATLAGGRQEVFCEEARPVPAPDFRVARLVFPPATPQGYPRESARALPRMGPSVAATPQLSQRSPGRLYGAARRLL